MAFKIFKQTLDIIPEQIVSLPQDATILAMQNQDNMPTFWYSFDHDLKKSNRKIKIKMIGTGYIMDIPHDSRKYGYLGTVQIAQLVWHFFFFYEQYDE